MQNALTLVHAPNPLVPMDGRVVIDGSFLPGETVQAYLARVRLIYDVDCAVITLNGKILRDGEPHLLNEGDILIVRALAGKSGGSNPISMVLSIALSLAAPGLGMALPFASEAVGFGTSMVWGDIFSGVIKLVGGLAISAMFGSSANKPLSNAGGQGSPSPTYSITGGSNRVRPYEPIPIIIGTHRIMPDYGAAYYTEYDNIGTRPEDLYQQFFSQIFTVCLNTDVDLSDWKIGEDALEKFSDWEMQESGADGALTLVAGNVNTSAGGTLVNTGKPEPMTRTTAENTIGIGVDLALTLYAVASDSGKFIPMGTNVVAMYRKTPPAAQTAAIDALQNEYEAAHTAPGAATFPAELKDYEWKPFWADADVAFDGYWSAGYWVTAPFGGGTTWQQVAFGSTDHAQHQSGESYTSSAQQTLNVLQGGTTQTASWRWRKFSEETISQAEFPNARSYKATSFNRYFESASPKPMRISSRISVAAGQYDVRLYHANIDTADTNNSGQNGTTWQNLHSYQADDGAWYSHMKRVAMRIRATGQLNSQISTLSCLAKAKAPVWKSAENAWVVEPTSNPAWWYLWFALGKRINGRRWFGGGIPIARINVDEIKLWGAWCDANNLKINCVFDGAMSFGEIINRIARAGRAQPSRASGKLGVVWDAANAPPVAAFGMANIKAGSFEISYIGEKLPDEFIGRYVDEDQGYTQQVVRETVPGVTSPQTSVEVEIFGVTNKQQAIRDIRLQAAEQYYRKRRITFETDVEGLVVTRGDVILMQHDLTQWGYSGRVLAQVGNNITLDRSVPLIQGIYRAIVLVYPDGTWQQRNILSEIEGDTTDTPVLSCLGDALPDMGADPRNVVWYYSPLETNGKRCKVISYQPTDMYHVRLICTDEEPGFYAYEHGGDFAVAASPTVNRPQVNSVVVTEEVYADNSVKVHLSWGLTRCMQSLLKVGVNGAAQEVARGEVTEYTIDCTRGDVLTVQIVPIGIFGRIRDELARDVTYRDINTSAGGVRQTPTATGEFGADLVAGAIGTWTQSTQIANTGSTLTQPGKTPDVSVSADAEGNVIITFKRYNDPQVTGYELREGANFDSGIPVASTATGDSFTLPLATVTGKTYTIKAVYSSGYGSSSYTINFAAGALKSPDGLSWRVSEPDLVWSWGAVPNAAQYVTYWEDGGVTRIAVTRELSMNTPIPKWSNALFRVVAVGADGSLSKPSEEEVTLIGRYNYNEIVNVNLPLTNGKYVNLAFTASNTIKRASVLGLAPVAPYFLNINDGDLFAFGYNLQNLAGSTLANVPGDWFRQDFWKEREGYFESAVVDLGALLSGRLALNITKTITYYGGAGTNFAHVNGQYLADYNAAELEEQRAFVTARFLAAADSANSANWREVNNGDWVSGVRYLKLVVAVGYASPLTEVTVTAGGITIDVPDVTESGSVTGVTSAGKAITFSKPFKAVNAGVATARGNAKAWITGLSATGCTLWVDTGTQQVDYFVKGY